MNRKKQTEKGFHDMLKRFLMILCCTACSAVFAQATVIDQSTAEPAAEKKTQEENAAAENKAKTPRPYTFVKLFRSNADPERYAEPADAAELFKQREKLVKKLHETKRQVVRNNERAGKIQKEIRKLLDELTLIIESREDVKSINAELQKIDAKLDALPLKEKNDKKK